MKRQIVSGSGPCQVVTEFLSGDHLKQGLHRADGFAEQVDAINLTQGIDTILHYAMVEQSNVKSAHRKYIG